MRWIRTEKEVDMIIDELVSNTKGNYITQGVAFNKHKKSHMDLLRMVLRSSYSFSGFIKELLAEKFNEENEKLKKVLNTFEEKTNDNEPIQNTLKPIKKLKTVENTLKENSKEEVKSNLDIGNFIL